MAHSPRLGRVLVEKCPECRAWPLILGHEILDSDCGDEEGQLFDECFPRPGLVVSYKVDLERFVEDVLDSVSDLPDALAEALKARMIQTDSSRKTDLQKILEEVGHD